MLRDLFLCHASEDKPSVVRPLHVALVAAGVSSWLDEAEIRWGDSVVDKINEGLRDSRFVIVVLSISFLNKSWARKELASSLSIESSTGVVRVLPLLVGAPDERQTVIRQLPLLADKFHLTWEGDPIPIVEAARLRLDSQETPADPKGRSVASTSVASELLYCARCGQHAGTRSTCTGTYAHHEFTKGSGLEFCLRCGQKAGTRSICTGTYAFHEFRKDWEIQSKISGP